MVSPRIKSQVNNQGHTTKKPRRGEDRPPALAFSLPDVGQPIALKSEISSRLAPIVEALATLSAEDLSALAAIIEATKPQ